MRVFIVFALPFSRLILPTAFSMGIAFTCTPNAVGKPTG